MRHWFKKIEGGFKRYLSHRPILYAVIGGVGVVLFWRGVWHLADAYEVGSIISIVIGILLLVPTGLLVSVFIGDHVLISGLRGEEKMAARTEKDVEEEKKVLGEEHWEMEEMLKRLDRIEHELEDKGKQ